MRKLLPDREFGRIFTSSIKSKIKVMTPRQWNEYQRQADVIEREKQRLQNIKVKCGVNNQWMWSIENACITIYSPTGGYVRIDKRHLKSDTPKELVELVWRIADEKDVIELTVEEMKLLTTYPKAKICKK